MSRVPRFPYEPEDLKSASNPEPVKLAGEVLMLRGVCILLISLLDSDTKTGFANELRRAATYAGKRAIELNSPSVSHFSNHLSTIAKEAGEIVIPFNHDS